MRLADYDHPNASKHSQIFWRLETSYKGLAMYGGVRVSNDTQKRDWQRFSATEQPAFSLLFCPFLAPSLRGSAPEVSTLAVFWWALSGNDVASAPNRGPPLR
jgi:hypothetical protein